MVLPSKPAAMPVCQSQHPVFKTCALKLASCLQSLLERKGVKDMKVIRIDLDAAQREKMVQRSGGRRTVPQIFINNTHVGGHDDLVALDRAGKLDPLLAG